jgi:hypothetical protein
MGQGIQPHLLSAQMDADLEQWACALLSGAPSWPQPPLATAQLLHYLDFHGITGLLASRLLDLTDRASIDADTMTAVRRVAARSVVRELLLKDELGRVLSAAHDRDLHPLVLKGTALAYSVYPEPALRARNDVDVLIPVERKAEMGALLEAHGYVADVIAGEHWATSERGFTKALAGDVVSRIDLHWRLNNSPVFWHRDLEYACVSRDAQPLPSLHAHARAPRVPMLLLHACLHRASHMRAPLRVHGVAYRVVNRLIWLYDIHVLAAGLSRDEWPRVLHAADVLGIRQVCWAALHASMTRLKTPIPADVLAAFREAGGEPASRHLDGSAWALKLSEFRAVPAPARWPWLREHLFPSAAYMRARFPDRPRAPLALLYARRLLSR